MLVISRAIELGCEVSLLTAFCTRKLELVLQFGVGSLWQICLTSRRFLDMQATK